MQEKISLLLSQKGEPSEAIIKRIQKAFFDNGQTEHFERYEKFTGEIDSITANHIIDFLKQNPEILNTVNLEVIEFLETNYEEKFDTIFPFLELDGEAFINFINEGKMESYRTFLRRYASDDFIAELDQFFDVSRDISNYDEEQLTGLQLYLYFEGYYSKKIDGKPGPGIEAAINNYLKDGIQKSPYYIKDGEIAQKVLETYGIKNSGSPARDAVIAQALSHAGVREEDFGHNFDFSGELIGYDDGANNGAAIKQYTGTEGKAWCVPFISRMLLNVSQGSKSKPELLKYSFTTENLQQQAKDLGALKINDPDFRPKPGDIALFRMDSSSSDNPNVVTGHAVIILAIDYKNDNVLTVEGNSVDAARINAYEFDPEDIKENHIISIERLPGFDALEKEFSNVPYKVSAPPIESLYLEIMDQNAKALEAFREEQGFPPAPHQTPAPDSPNQPPL